MAPRVLSVACLIAIFVSSPAAVWSQEPAPSLPVPTKAELQKLLETKPVSRETWPFWRKRYLAWYFDRTSVTRPMDDALAAFVAQEAQEQAPLLPDWLAGDPAAWIMLGDSYVDAKISKTGRADPAAAVAAYRQAVQLDESFAPGHSRLAGGLIFEALHLTDPSGAAEQAALLNEAAEEIQTTVRLFPAYRPAHLWGMHAFAQKQFAVAEERFREAMTDYPHSVATAMWYLQSIMVQENHVGPFAAISAPLVERFPEEGPLRVFHGLALARDADFAAAVAALDEAEDLGVDPAEVLGAETVAQIRKAGEPGLLARFLWLMAYFGIGYAAVIAFMAASGALLSAATPRVPQPGRDEEGAGVITRRESLLGRLYMMTLMTGLLLFYISIPFVVAGLLAITAGVVILMFMAPVISIKLLIIVVIIGLGMGWAVLKSVFASHGRGSFGVKKTAQDCPRLHAALREVAEKTATDPIDDVYIAPGSAIGVHQEGRGPFGVFGVKRRVLTLGLSTLHYLSISELKAILAHEYAHFSHRDTFYSRFIHQVTLSIENALIGMAQYGGSLNYVNPFYWFFWLYYRAYSLLASGFSRSREFLADRAAVRLYGKKAFISGLTKVATDGAFFEASIYHNISALLSQGKAFINMYDAFRAQREAGLSPEDREKMYAEMLNERSSLFHTHPTYGERVQATVQYPDVPEAEEESALQLFDDAESLEREMTEYLTGYIHTIQLLQAQAAADV